MALAFSPTRANSRAALDQTQLGRRDHASPICTAGRCPARAAQIHIRWTRGWPRWPRTVRCGYAPACANALAAGRPGGSLRRPDPGEGTGVHAPHPRTAPIGGQRRGLAACAARATRPWRAPSGPPLLSVAPGTTACPPVDHRRHGELDRLGHSVANQRSASASRVGRAGSGSRRSHRRRLLYRCKMPQASSRLRRSGPS
jgi:hypothetical protein